MSLFCFIVQISPCPFSVVMVSLSSQNCNVQILKTVQFISFSQLNKQAVFCSYYISIPKYCTDMFVLLCQLI